MLEMVRSTKVVKCSANFVKSLRRKETHVREWHLMEHLHRRRVHA